MLMSRGEIEVCLLSTFCVRSTKIDAKLEGPICHFERKKLTVSIPLFQLYSSASVIMITSRYKTSIYTSGPAANPPLYALKYRYNTLYTRPKNAQSRRPIADRHSASLSDHLSVVRTQFSVLESAGATPPLRTAPMQAGIAPW